MCICDNYVLFNLSTKALNVADPSSSRTTTWSPAPLVANRLMFQNLAIAWSPWIRDHLKPSSSLSSTELMWLYNRRLSAKLIAEPQTHLEINITPFSEVWHHLLASVFHQQNLPEQYRIKGKPPMNTAKTILPRLHLGFYLIDRVSRLRSAALCTTAHHSDSLLS